MEMTGGDDFPRGIDSMALANVLTSALEERPTHSVVVHDESLRDGEQTVGVTFSAEQKIDIARRLIASGVRHLSLGFPAVSDEEREIIRAIVKDAPDTRGLSCLARAVPADIQAVVECDIPNVSLFISTSDVHLDRKLKMTEEEARRRACDSVRMAVSYGLRVRFALEDASRTPLERIFRVAEDVLTAGAKMITICDTVGILTPLSTYRLIGQLKKRFGSETLCVHFHDDLGMATANSLVAYLAGAGMLQGTLVGTGERAGNARLEELVVALLVKYSVDLGIDIHALMAAADHVRQLIGFPLAPNQPLSGQNVFAHESGIHVHGLLADAATYEPFPPEVVGARHSIRYGKHSGLSSLEHLCRKLSISVPNEELAAILEQIKHRASTGTPLGEAEIAEALRRAGAPSRVAG